MAAPPVHACDASLLRQFAPNPARIGTYEVCSSAASLDDELAALRKDGLMAGPVELAEAVDAFGTAGDADRSKIARLYGGRRARVARGYRDAQSRTESFTLISPYPDATLTRLLDGTLLIRYEVRTAPLR